MRGLKFKKYVQWAVDADYIDTLSETDRDWYLKFLDEYYNSTMKDEPLHNTPELRSEAYAVNNRAREDLYSILDSGGAIIFQDSDEPTKNPTKD